MMGSHGARSWVGLEGTARQLVAAWDEPATDDYGTHDEYLSALVGLLEPWVESLRTLTTTVDRGTPSPGDAHLWVDVTDRTVTVERAAGSGPRCPAQQALVDALDEVGDASPVAVRAALEARGYTITPRVPEGVAGQPTDEPTEADPPSCVALDEHVNTLRFFVSSVRKFHGECEVACRPGCAMDVDAAEAVTCVLDEIERLRVGGRSAAPTRDEIVEAIRSVRSPEGYPYQSLGEGWPIPEAAADAVVALLSRSAAEPPEDETAALRSVLKHVPTVHEDPT